MSDSDSNALPDDDDGDEGGDGRGRKRPGKQRDYEVGYGKPPRAHQFPKGVSGNPRGPKKGKRGLKTDLHKALSAPHTIKVDGKLMKGTTQELAMYTLAKRAGTGDVRAIRQLVDLTLRIFGAEDRGRERGALSPQDQELLDRMLGRIDPDAEAANTEDDATDDDAGDGGDNGDPDAGDRDNTEHDGGPNHDKS